MPITSNASNSQKELHGFLLAQQQVLQQVVADSQKAVLAAGTQSQMIDTLQAELAELQSESQRMRSRLVQAGLELETETPKVKWEAAKVSKIAFAPDTTEATAVVPMQQAPSYCLPSSSGSSKVTPITDDTNPEPPGNQAPVLKVSKSSVQTENMFKKRMEKAGSIKINFEDPARHEDTEIEVECEEPGRRLKASVRPSVGNLEQLRETMMLLGKVPIFQRLPEEQLVVVAAACLTCKYPPGTVFLKQGSAASSDDFFIITGGTVHLNVDGKRVNSLKMGDYFGEQSLLHGEGQPATATAETQVSALVLRGTKFKELSLDEQLVIPPRDEYARKPKQVFADATAMKEKLRQAMMKPPYDVRNFYHEKGVMQKIARSKYFDNATLSVIAFNAAWIAVDTDRNTADTLLTAHPVFVVAENFFCLYFSTEWLVRFCSFRIKRDGLRDAWFVFDSCLVGSMVIETWVMNLVVMIAGGQSGGAMGNASILRLFRLLRLSRMARMARLLRAMPELMVLIKGMAVAMRSVLFTLVLLGGIIYIFSIMFVQLMKDTAMGEQYFPTVPEAMNSLLLDGTLPDQARIITDVGSEGWVFRIIILFYILLASMTVMNMLVGVLCEVVSVVSAVEKESMLVSYVKGTLLHMLENSGLDADGDKQIARDEFEYMLENPAAAKALTDVGVDVVGLVDFTDFIFKDGRQLSFPDFMDMVLSLRGTNVATVKEIVDLRKLLTSECDKIVTRTGQALTEILTHVHGENRTNRKSIAAAFGVNSSMGSDSSMSLPGSPTGPASPHKQPMGYFNNSMDAYSPHSVQDLSISDMPTASWATAAAVRLSAAAGELSAAASELSARNNKQQQGFNQPVLPSS